MTREEFITKLREALRGSVPEDVIRVNVNYYQNYINEEMAKGRSEEDVLSGLGDPRLIAHTILDAQPSSQAGGESNRQSNTYQNEDYQNNENRRSSVNRGVSWKPVLILVLVILIIIMVVSSVIGMVFRILFSPVFWIVIAALALLSFFSSRRR